MDTSKKQTTFPSLEVNLPTAALREREKKKKKNAANKE
jgi:hypothetical protein